jgi:hypothetical protein
MGLKGDPGIKEEPEMAELELGQARVRCTEQVSWRIRDALETRLGQRVARYNLAMVFGPAGDYVFFTRPPRDPDSHTPAAYNLRGEREQDEMKRGLAGFAQADLGHADSGRRVGKWIEQTREHAIECGGITTAEAERWLAELHDLWMAVLAEYQREAFDAGMASSRDTLTAIARDIVDAEQSGDWEEAGRRIALKVERAGVPLPDHRRIL